MLIDEWVSAKLLAKVIDTDMNFDANAVCPLLSVLPGSNQHKLLIVDDERRFSDHNGTVWTGVEKYILATFFSKYPCNLLLQKMGARVWIARILITRGVVAALTGAGRELL